MAQPPRTPPRFVPTLTEVVQPPPAVAGGNEVRVPARRTTVMAPPAPPASGAGGRHPPLDEAHTVSVGPPPLPSARPPAVMTHRSPAGSSAAAQPGPAATAPLATPRPAVPAGMEEYMVHRVMQRVDVVLDQRLREAIATVVQEQTRSVLPRLREEIESVVRHAVYEAVADELASGPQATPGALRR